jgi:hypothetical protein
VIGIVLGLAGIAVALGIPLFIEWSRRPRLRIQRADDANRRDAEPPWRVVHVKVANEPLRGWRSRCLLRNPATSCRVEVIFKSESDGAETRMPGRWAAGPEPISRVVFPPRVDIEYLPIDPSAGVPDVQWHFDPTKLPQSARLDISADSEGEPVPIALKYRGEEQAFGFTGESYAYDGWRNPNLALPDERYTVTVRASAGGITAKADFRLDNSGDAETHFRLQSIE